MHCIAKTLLTELHLAILVPFSQLSFPKSATGRRHPSSRRVRVASTLAILLYPPRYPSSSPRLGNHTRLPLARFSLSTPPTFDSRFLSFFTVCVCRVPVPEGRTLCSSARNSPTSNRRVGATSPTGSGVCVAVVGLENRWSQIPRLGTASLLNS